MKELELNENFNQRNPQTKADFRQTETFQRTRQTQEFPDGRGLAISKKSAEFKLADHHQSQPQLAYTDKQPFTTHDLLGASQISELSSYRPQDM